MRRRVRQSQYRERHLAQVAQIAGTSFGAMDFAEPATHATLARNRIFASAAPLLLVLPVVASLAWFLTS